MATNKTNKKSNIKTVQQIKDDKGVAKGEKQGLMNIAEVRMVLYVVPVAAILALFVYFVTR
jgi:hypothetical protein